MFDWFISSHTVFVDLRHMLIAMSRVEHQWHLKFNVAFNTRYWSAVLSSVGKLDSLTILVPGTRVLVPGTRVLRSRKPYLKNQEGMKNNNKQCYLDELPFIKEPQNSKATWAYLGVPGTRWQKPGTWYQVPGTRHRVPFSWTASVCWECKKDFNESNSTSTTTTITTIVVVQTTTW